MHRSRRRWLVVFSVLAALGLTLGLTVEGGSAASKKQLCSSTTKKPSASDIQRYGHRAIHRIYIICKTAPKGKVVNGRPGPTGPAGPKGPPGPAGAPGPAGQNIPNTIFIQRTAIPFASGFMYDGGNTQNLATIGPIHIDGECRHTFPGPSGAPATGGGNQAPTYLAPGLPSRGGESEAHVLVWSETGSLTFKGAHGHRENIPSGPPDVTQETNSSPPTNGHTAGGTDQPVKDPVAGEGDHLFLSASNENPDEARATDPAADNQSDPNVKQLGEYPAFNYSGGVISTSDGHIVFASMLAGFDVLGVYGECVFAGVLRPLS